MEEKKLRRSCDKVVAGVCAGLGEYLGIDPIIVRIVWALLTLSTIGTGLLLYIILWIIMPECPTDSTTPSAPPPAQ